MKKVIKKILLTGVIIAALGSGYVIYLFNMPHRDVQSVSAFVEIESDLLVNEFLMNLEEANSKYLAEDGESKVIIVRGRVASITEDQRSQKVILLKEENTKVGVNVTFMHHTNKNVNGIKIGDIVSIKGVVRSGAEFDEDLDLYEDVIIEKSDIVKS